MALTWTDINSVVNPEILPTIADLVYKSSTYRRPRTGMHGGKTFSDQAEPCEVTSLRMCGNRLQAAVTPAAVETEREGIQAGWCDSPFFHEDEVEEVRRNDGSRVSGNKQAPLFIRVRTSNAQRFDGGTNISQPIGYAELNGGPFARGGTFNTDYVQTDTKFFVVPKYLSSGYSPTC